MDNMGNFIRSIYETIVEEGYLSYKELKEDRMRA